MKKGMLVLMIILIILVLGMGGYLVYDKVLSKDEVKEEKIEEKQEELNKDSTKNEVKDSDFVAETTYTTKFEGKTYTVDVDVNKYNNIFEYIEKQDNVSMYISYCTDADYEELEKDSLEKYSGKYELSKAEVVTVLTEMKKSTRNTASGLGGICVPTVVINYSRNNVSKHVDFYSVYAISDTNDGNIYKIYENGLTQIEEYPTYAFNDLSETLKNKLIEVANRY